MKTQVSSVNQFTMLNQIRSRIVEAAQKTTSDLQAIQAARTIAEDFCDHWIEHELDKEIIHADEVNVYAKKIIQTHVEEVQKSLDLELRNLSFVKRFLFLALSKSQRRTHEQLKEIAGAL